MSDATQWDESEPLQEDVDKPWWQRWWAIALVVLILVIVLVAVTGGDETAEIAEEPTETAEPTEPTEAIETETPGDIQTEQEEAAEEIEEEATEEEEPEGPVYETIAYQGNGDDIITIAIPDDLPSIAHITHQGSANFAVEAVDEDGNSIDLLVNEIGNYAGVRPLNFVQDEEVAEFEITADGGWTVEIDPLSEAPEMHPQESAGSGDFVLLVRSEAQGSPVRVTHNGDSNFAILAYGDMRHLLVNEIGSYEGTVRMPGDALALDIQADGDWAITPR